jgi:mono/diheme cytochrome c family protein
MAALVALAAWMPAARADLSARANYMIHCQGCHMADGSGREPDVPSLAPLGRFTALDAGRRYLTQVPGASQAPISDRELAAVLNWVLVTYSAAALPPDFLGYTEEEVARSRHDRPLDILAVRRSLLAELGNAAASAR